MLARFALPLLLATLAAAQDSPGERRRQALDVLLHALNKSRPPATGRINALDKTWEDWQRRTGELPPDFGAMPSIPLLPDPLAGVKTAADWQRRRAWIRSQFEQWVFGKLPPAPGNLTAQVTATRMEGAVTVRDVLLRFGPGGRGSLRVQVMIPPGKGPFPVFLTNHPRTRPWVATAVRRGYIGCIYFAADPIYGNADDSDAFIELYPEYDFSCLARWAWAAMRAVDYLYTLPEVDKKKIGISGHSRNGKQALLAAAFDERIGAAVPSSGNTGEGTPWRYTTDPYANESLEQITGNFAHWFHPRLRFFAGREHKLPVDQNSLMALVAPRGLMLATSFSEAQGAPFGFEQAYRSVRRVFEFTGAPRNVDLYIRPGDHPTTAGDIERYVDFFDTVFGRAAYPRFENPLYGYSFEGWKKLSGETAPPPAPAPTAPLRERIRWLLGEEPAGLDFPARATLTGRTMTTDGWLGAFHGRPFAEKGMGSAAISFGDDLKADLYYPLDAGGKPAPGRWPVVVWLHALSHATGYSRYTRPTFASLTGRGFAVLAFDQLGFGTRAEYADRFYHRYPKWSLLGKMVADTRAAVAAAAALENVDASRIYLCGWSLGAKVALFTAALDERVAGIAAVAGFTPLRRATADKGIEGILEYSHLHGLAPRAGFFIGQEGRLPVDYDEILAAIAPRPVLVWAPRHDRYNPVEDVRAAVEAARTAYRAQGRPDGLRIETPVDFNRFPREAQERVFDWLAGLGK